MEQNTVILSLEKYEELIETKYQMNELNKYIGKLALEKIDLKEALLETQTDYYNIRHYGLDEITNLDNFNFGLNNKIELLRFFTKEELIEFIKRKKAEIEKEDE